MESMIIVNECVDCRIKGHISRIIGKLNFGKVYVHSN